MMPLRLCYINFVFPCKTIILLVYQKIIKNKFTINNLTHPPRILTMQLSIITDYFGMQFSLFCIKKRASAYKLTIIIFIITRGKRQYLLLARDFIVVVVAFGENHKSEHYTIILMYTYTHNMGHAQMREQIDSMPSLRPTRCKNSGRLRWKEKCGSFSLNIVVCGYYLQ